ncbi:uncharacterized protein BKA78DRAFT_231138, partial [Phyllosticta capitalensis]|uniref:uncharacterized protein n=1 Tax=Phyllosticta capitalensis TaxID=121624 RepID=UPI0031302179
PTIPNSKNPVQLPPIPSTAIPSTQATNKLRGGGQVKLDALGPMVVNKDGTLSRIANWQKMTEIEKRNTLRILGKRNQLR